MVLVTGGTGFLGAYIIKALVEQGESVRAIRRANSKIPFFIPSNIFEKVQWVEGDILDVITLDVAMQGVDAIVHAAAKVSFHASEKKEMYHVNVEGTANVVNVALENNIKQLIYISSVAALGRTANGETVNEEKEWVASGLHTNYAISKQKAEMEVWRGIGEGLNAVILNPSTILGFGDWNNSSSALFKNVYNEFPYYTSGVNGFVAVEDVAAITVKMLQSNITAKSFIVNAENWSFKKLLDTMADGFGKKKPYRHATPFLSQLAWRMEALKAMASGTKPLLTKETARVAQSKTYFDNSNLLKAFPTFSFIPLEQAIQKTCHQYLQALQGLPIIKSL